MFCVETVFNELGFMTATTRLLLRIDFFSLLVLTPSSFSFKLSVLSKLSASELSQASTLEPSSSELSTNKTSLLLPSNSSSSDPPFETSSPSLLFWIFLFFILFYHYVFYYCYFFHFFLFLLLSWGAWYAVSLAILTSVWAVMVLFLLLLHIRRLFLFFRGVGGTLRRFPSSARQWW